MPPHTNGESRKLGYRGGGWEENRVARILRISRKMNLASLLRLSRSCANSGLPGLLFAIGGLLAGGDAVRKSPELPARSAHVVCASERLPKQSRSMSTRPSWRLDKAARFTAGRFAFQPSRDGDGASVERAAARHASRAMKAIRCGTAGAALFRARTVAHGGKLLLAPS